MGISGAHLPIPFTWSPSSAFVEHTMLERHVGSRDGWLSSGRGRGTVDLVVLYKYYRLMIQKSGVHQLRLVVSPNIYKVILHSS